MEGEMTSRIILGYNLKCQESRLRKRLKSKDLAHWSKVVKRKRQVPTFSCLSTLTLWPSALNKQEFSHYFFLFI